MAMFSEIVSCDLSLASAAQQVLGTRGCFLFVFQQKFIGSCFT